MPHHRTAPYAIDGACDARFGAVRDAFAAGFAGPDGQRETGAALCVILGGRVVADLWGGHRDAAGRLPWQHGTRVNMMSVGKAMLALVPHILADRGVLDLDAPVARLWPEFGAAGKQDLRLRWLLDHRAGLPHAAGAVVGEAHDWDRMVARLAAQAPLWEPGTTPCYHTLTYGFLLGEVVRRATGLRFAEAFQRLVAGPLGAAYGFCLGASEQAECATFMLPPAAAAAPDSLAAKAHAGLDAAEDRNSARHRAAELYAVNGHGTVRGIARIYAALAAGGTLDGVSLLSAEALSRATSEQWRGTEVMTGRMSRMGLGFRLPDANTMVGPGPRAFGHGGRGGAIAFADPDLQLAFAYAPGRAFPGGSGESPHARRMRDAVHACL
jgi:CubicO group peptidase (beta-lactamase class C family)